ncbi:hypothetical protein FA09DRAFT_325924 [Tilletiopsis washingtonensis]|uniref:Uncharacterized protein n=1 Tax=Tilletiopsis washingtonensis TaxID=58919 RepID=A0A316Z6H7_9BASI|nr:hypothetical protein FA09DRAFT_325924 [Tilletiopsis washingtonensis]PWN97171.1 hypothetical protein FA09DRAFT_325924 [Tilletiopsis washingtonensis]
MDAAQFAQMVRDQSATISMQARSIDRLTDNIVELLKTNAEQARTITQQARLIEEQEIEQTYDCDDSSENRADAKEKEREEGEERALQEAYMKRKAEEDAKGEEEVKKARIEEQAEFINDSEAIEVV